MASSGFSCNRNIGFTRTEVLGAEVLVRWAHPERGLLGPACVQARKLHDAGVSNVRLAINATSLDFHDPGFSGNVQDTLRRHDVAGREKKRTAMSTVTAAARAA